MDSIRVAAKMLAVALVATLALACAIGARTLTQNAPSARPASMSATP